MPLPASPSATSKPAEDSGFDPERFFARLETIGHTAAIGMKWSANGPDWVELALPWRAELVGNPATGVMASSPIVAMMDNATSLAVWTLMGSFRPQATLDLRVDFLRPARSGLTVIGRGECYRITRSVAFVRGVAHDGAIGDPVAHVAGTFMFTGEAWA